MSNLMQMLVRSLQPKVCPSRKKVEFVSSSEMYDPINNHNGLNENKHNTHSGCIVGNNARERKVFRTGSGLFLQ